MSGSAATTRRTLTAAGKCSVCLRRQASPGRPTCRHCREAIAAYSAALYAARRSAQQCTRPGCGEPATGHLCEPHAEERRQRRRA